MPQTFSMMLSVSWFGIPSSDPQGDGGDSGYGNWEWGGGCIVTNNPAECSEYNGTDQRIIASKRRPLAGIYSSTGQTEESLARVDLMLSNLRKPSDDGAKIDAWAVQLSSLQFSSLHTTTPDFNSETPYRAMKAFYSRAAHLNLTNSVMPGYDATWTFNFGHYLGLGYCNDTTPGSANDRQKCVQSVQADLVDMVNLAMQNKDSTVLINGKPIILAYVDAGSQYLWVSEWDTILQNARNITGQDFYIVGTTLFSSFFEVFDGLSPWVNLGIWNTATGDSTYERAYNWVDAMHSSLFNDISAYPGRVVFGGVSPGFDDYTENWGACTDRIIPRERELLNATFDYLKSKNVTGIVLETWDDWTEGTEFEPDVAEGPSLLVLLRQNLGKLYGEPSDPAGDQRLADRWINYGQARNCSGIPIVTSDISSSTNSADTQDSSTTSDSSSSSPLESSSDFSSASRATLSFCTFAAVVLFLL
jgi:hypothetical protein